jgi:hypothetical protein
MAPVLAGERGPAEASERAVGDSGLERACLLRIEASLRRCWSSSAMFFSLDFCHVLAPLSDN